MKQQTTPKPIPFIRELCGEKSEEEILEAENNFREFLKLTASICERLEREEATIEAIDKLLIDDTV